MTPEPILIGIDVGTTNFKAAAYDTAGRPIACAHVPTPTRYPRPGWAYFDPDEVWDLVTSILRQVSSALTEHHQVAGLAITGMAEAGVPVDKDGRWVYPVIAWYDNRTQEQAEWWQAEVGLERLYAITGLPPLFIFGINKMMWLKAHEPDAYRRTVRWLNMADYIAFKLSGAEATDYSLASRTLAFDLRTLSWSDELIRLSGVRPDLFARPVPSGEVVGHVTAEAAARHRPARRHARGDRRARPPVRRAGRRRDPSRRPVELDRHHRVAADAARPGGPAPRDRPRRLYAGRARHAGPLLHHGRAVHLGRVRRLAARPVAAGRRPVLRRAPRAGLPRPRRGAAECSSCRTCAWQCAPRRSPGPRDVHRVVHGHDARRAGPRRARGPGLRVILFRDGHVAHGRPAHRVRRDRRRRDAQRPAHTDQGGGVQSHPGDRGDRGGHHPGRGAARRAGRGPVSRRGRRPAHLQVGRRAVAPDPALASLYAERYQAVYVHIYSALRDLHHTISERFIAGGS